jgi:hypothetical protein
MRIKAKGRKNLVAAGKKELATSLEIYRLKIR